jgi:hypothetical protein
MFLVKDNNIRSFVHMLESQKNLMEDELTAGLYLRGHVVKWFFLSSMTHVRFTLICGYLVLVPVELMVSDHLTVVSIDLFMINRFLIVYSNKSVFSGYVIGENHEGTRRVLEFYDLLRVV